MAVPFHYVFLHYIMQTFIPVRCPPPVEVLGRAGAPGTR